MKQCPECNFHFPDFSRVCDFDGSELVENSECRSLIRVKASPRRSRFDRSMNSPAFWSVLLLSALTGNAFLAVYYDDGDKSAAVVKVESSTAASINQNPISASEPSTQVKEPVVRVRDTTLRSNRLASPITIRRQKATPSRSLAQVDQTRVNQMRVDQTRVNQTRIDQNRAPNRTGFQIVQVARSEQIENAQREDTRLNSHGEGLPKLSTIAKTTWRVLKKPFKF